jgi:hypothetical protein
VAISAEKQRKQDETRARLLAFLLEHGRSRVQAGHVALARGLARQGLVRMVDLRPGHAVELVPGKEDEAKRFIAEHGRKEDEEIRQVKRRLLEYW